MYQFSYDVAVPVFLVLQTSAPDEGLLLCRLHLSHSGSLLLQLSVMLSLVRRNFPVVLPKFFIPLDVLWIICSKDIAFLKYENIKDGVLTFIREKPKHSTTDNIQKIEIFITEDLERLIDQWGRKLRI
ncbi:MAG: hypothetical protein ABI472_18425 [Ginsengibacter sp.]